MKASGTWVARVAVVVLAAVVGAGVVGAESAWATEPPLKVVMEFDGSGTFSAINGAGTDSPEHADVAMKWSTTYVGELQSDGSITFTATGAAGSGEVTQTTAAPPGTFHFTSSGLDSANCSGSLPLAPGAPAPTATDSGGTLTVQSITAVDQNDNTGQISCQGTGPLGDAVDLSADAANLAGAFGPYLPDVLTARVSLPPDALKSGSYTVNVKGSDAPQQLPGSCADQFGLPEGQCPMSLTWSGTIKITTPCGVISLSEGDAAPPVGTIINPGQTVSTGPKSRVEITLPDGGVYQLGPNSSMRCSGQTTFVQPPEHGIKDSLHLVLGTIWGAINDAIGPSHEFEDERAMPVGNRGSAFTESLLPNGQVLFHVIQGVGFIIGAHQHEVDFPAGDGVLVNSKHRTYTVTTSWPAAARALVPSAQLTPKLTNLTISRARAGARPILRFRLNEPAAVTVQIQRGKRRVLQRKQAARPGTRAIKLGVLRRGSYTLTVFATEQHRSTAAQKTFRIR
jgi:hypothetical protein